MEKNRQSPHQASKMQLYSSYTELECIPILTCNLGLEIWSIHFKNQTHLEIVSWTRWRQHSYVLQISSFMANYTLYHKGPTSQDCLFFFFTGQPSHQIKLVCNQFFLFTSVHVSAAARATLSAHQRGVHLWKHRTVLLNASHLTFPDWATRRQQKAPIAPKFDCPKRGAIVWRGTQKVQLLQGGKRIRA